MIAHMTCIVVDADTANREELATFLADNGVEVAAAFSSAEGVPSLLSQQDPPRLVLINLDPSPHESLRRIGPWIGEFSSTSFFAMSEKVDPSLLMEAMHLGVKEFLSLPVEQDRLLAGIERVGRRVTPEHNARVIHLIPAGGGCGSTTVACNVAASLSANARVIALDLDLVRGGVAEALNLRPRYTIADLMDPAAKLDRALLDNALVIHEPTGLAVLARPDLPEDARRVTKLGLQRLLALASRCFDYVVIDSQMSADPIYQSALQAADLNVIVMQLNVPSAKNTERFLAAMRRMGIPEDRVRVVVNRSNGKGGDLDPAEVEKAIGCRISWTIPNDFKNAITSMNLGQPVVLRTPKAVLSDSLRELSHLLNGRNAPKNPAPAAKS